MTELPGIEKKPKKQVREWQGWEPREFTPSHCVDLIQIMSTGRCPTAFNAKHNLSRAMFYRWVSEHRDFNLAYAIGKELSKNYLYGMLHENAVELHDPQGITQKLNMAVWREIMKHQHQIPEAREASMQLAKVASGPKTMMTSVLEAVRAGLIDLEEAERLAKLIETSQKITETSELMAKIEALEAQLKGGASTDDFKEE